MHLFLLHNETMTIEDRPEAAQRLVQAREARGFETATAAIKYFSFTEGTYKNHEAGLRGFGKTADRYAKAFRVSAGWLLTGEGEAPEQPKIPVMGVAAGSIIGVNIIHSEAIDFVSRPPALDNVKDAYALFVSGRSMVPQFGENDLVFVHPHKTPVSGDAVVIQQSMNGEICAFIKTFKSYSESSLLASQHNPSRNVEYPKRTVLAVHKVLTTAELFRV